MSDNSHSEPQGLGTLASLVVLVGAALYFTGWVYRWAYFSFFQLEVTTLDLPLESFYIAAFQALLGGWGAIARTAIGIVLCAVGIYLTLWFVQLAGRRITHHLKQWRERAIQYGDRHRRSPVAQVLQSLAEFNSTHFNSIDFLRSLLDEIIIFLWALLILFFLAQWQADADAWIDAVNETSTLPVVTFLLPEDNSALGRKLDNPLINPAGFRIIGDKARYNRLLGREITQTGPQQVHRVWRLLIDRSGYFYIFPTLPNTANRSLRPPIVVIHESDRGDQLLILSPQPAAAE
jgi:hypothetical protein